MSIRLEDFLENPNLLTKELSLKNTIDTIIDDVGITNLPLTEDEIEKFRFPSDDDYYNEHLVTEIPDYLINDPEVVGYPSLEMQDDIYQWVRQYLPLQNYSIKDLGAGRGDFFNSFMNYHGIEYIGIESRESLVAAGKKKYSDINLIHGDFLKEDIQTDYTICIGTLNDRHGEDKWKYFNKILNHSLSNTNNAVIFVLSSNMDDLDNFYDYPMNELFENLPSNLPCKVDYSMFQDIYVLVVYVQPFT